MQNAPTSKNPGWSIVFEVLKVEKVKVIILDIVNYFLERKKAYFKTEKIFFVNPNFHIYKKVKKFFWTVYVIWNQNEYS